MTEAEQSALVGRVLREVADCVRFEGCAVGVGNYEEMQIRGRIADRCIARAAALAPPQGEEILEIVGSGPPGGWFTGDHPHPAEPDATVFLPDGHYVNGQRQDGEVVWLTREETIAICALIHNWPGPWAAEICDKLRSRLGAGK